MFNPNLDQLSWVLTAKRWTGSGAGVWGGAKEPVPVPLPGRGQLPGAGARRPRSSDGVRPAPRGHHAPSTSGAQEEELSRGGKGGGTLPMLDIYHYPLNYLCFHFLIFHYCNYDLPQLLFTKLCALHFRSFSAKSLPFIDIFKFLTFLTFLAFLTFFYLRWRALWRSRPRSSVRGRRAHRRRSGRGRSSCRRWQTSGSPLIRYSLTDIHHYLFLVFWDE